MPRRILVVPANHGAGVTSVCLGLARALERRRLSVGYVKPFAQPRRSGEDHSIELVRLATTLRPPQPVPTTRLEEALATGRLSSVMEEVIEVTDDVFASNAVVIIEGLAADDEQLYAGMVNAEVARALDADVVIVGSAARSGPERLADQVSATERHYRVQGMQRVVGAVVNRLGEDCDEGEFTEALTRRGLATLAVVRRRGEFTRLRVTDIARQLGLEMINDGDTHRRVGDVAIAAQALPAMLGFLVPERLMLVPADRHEILLAEAMAEMAGTRLAGLVLTAGVRPDPAVLQLCAPAFASGLPVLISTEPTFETAAHINDLDPEIPVDDQERVDVVASAMADVFDAEWMTALSMTAHVRRSTPPAFRRAVFRGARAQYPSIALTDATHATTLRVAVELAGADICRPVLVGDEAGIARALEQAGLELPPGIRIVDSAADCSTLLEGQAGLPPAARAGAESFMHGLSLLAEGAVEGVVGGVELDLDLMADLVTRVVSLRPEATTLSSVHYLVTPDEVFAYTDCALNESPSAADLASIARCCADDSQVVGITPRVAFVAPQGDGGSLSPADEAVTARLRQAADLLRGQRPDLTVVGPFTLAEASRRESDVEGAGNGSVFVFAGTRQGREAYRAAMRWPDTHSVGPILQGLRRPVNLTPHGATPADLRNIIVATAVQTALAT